MSLLNTTKFPILLLLCSNNDESTNVGILLPIHVDSNYGSHFGDVKSYPRLPMFTETSRHSPSVKRCRV